MVTRGWRIRALSHSHVVSWCESSSFIFLLPVPVSNIHHPQPDIVHFLFLPAHVDNEEQYVQAVEKFGDNCVSREDANVGAAFIKFAVFTRELSALFKNLVRSRIHSLERRTQDSEL